MNADRSLRPYGVDLSILKEVLAMICNPTSKLPLVRERRKLINVTAVRDHRGKKKKEKSHKEPDTS